MSNRCKHVSKTTTYSFLQCINYSFLTHKVPILAENRIRNINPHGELHALVTLDTQVFFNKG